VCLLQQALDQALGSLEELRTQVQDKQWIETQLAHTEQYANVQQQAIAQLKQQLSQFTEVQNHLLHVMGYRLNELIDHQQVEFNRLNIQFQQSNTELQTYLQYLGRQRSATAAAELSVEEQRLAVDKEVMIARSMAVNVSQHLTLAGQHLSSLSAALQNHHLNLSQIVKTIQAMIAELAAFEGGAPAAKTPSAAAPAKVEKRHLELAVEEIDPETLQATVQQQERRIQELEAAMREQFAHQTQLRQRFQELAVERDYYKRELERSRQENRPPESPLVVPVNREDSAQSPPPPMMPGRRRSQPPPPIQPLKLPDSLEL
jgi:chromosome segregation ATPase